MQYSVEMRVVAGRPTTAEEEVAFIEQVIFPSVEKLKRMQEEKKKILAGDAMSGTVGLAMIVEAGSALELDEI
jgi:hypothetical protein